MGFFDKAKQFLGGKNMASVAITVIERQPAETATFPVTDSVLKGTMVITAQQECTLLATKYEVWLYIKKDDIDSRTSPAPRRIPIRTSATRTAASRCLATSSPGRSSPSRGW
ncbi:hypothetical protein [Nannocystis pusilla]|uniref:hypothetical protein n=1 Tax=Nannocystis pusilla TaxID=889268 RepID=UPI003B7CBADE